MRLRSDNLDTGEQPLAGAPRPVVQALLSKGAAFGTVLAFMMAVIGLSLPEAVILRKVLKPRLLAGTNHAPTLNPVGPLTVQAGGVLPTALLKQLGVTIETKYGTL